MTPNQQGIIPYLSMSSNIKVEMNTSGDRVPRRETLPEEEIRQIATKDSSTGHQRYALQANLFITTTWELAKYAGRSYNSDGDICLATLTQEDVKLKLSTLEPKFPKADMKEVTDILMQT
eukprot:12655737-Ditylum_brightwellii.AAC.1